MKSEERFPEVSGRILAVDPAMTPDFFMEIKGIEIRAMLFRHGSWIETDSVTGKQNDIHQGIQNLGYSFEADGFSFFHSGDGSPKEKGAFRKYHLSSKSFDAVFLDRVFLCPEGMEIINEEIRTKKIILMHVEPGRMEYYKSLLKDFPEFYVPSGILECRILEK